jgi:hypothetical protein
MKIFMITIIAFLFTLNFSCADNKPNDAQKAQIDVIKPIERQVPEMDTGMDLEVTQEEAVAPLELQVSVEEVNSFQTPSLLENFKEQEVEATAPIEVSKSNEEEADTGLSISGENSENLIDNEMELITEEILVSVIPDHSAFDELLKKFVSATGVVNYKGLKSEVDKLNSYLSKLDKNPINSDWSRNEKLAYWINVYNAFTIKLILDNFPVNSIQDIADGKPWDLKWIKLGGKTYSLNQIENDIIRPEFNEPRIHFAVNCAAQSCPPLANQAFTAENLDSLLEKQTKVFINNTKYNKVSTSSAKVSRIFDWYGSDFGNVLSFLNKYLDKPLPAAANIDFLDYDWSLNNR